jgi:hypothetical protein
MVDVGGIIALAWCHAGVTRMQYEVEEAPSHRGRAIDIQKLGSVILRQDMQ